MYGLPRILDTSFVEKIKRTFEELFRNYAHGNCGGVHNLDVEIFSIRFFPIKTQSTIYLLFVVSIYLVTKIQYAILICWIMNVTASTVGTILHSYILLNLFVVIAWVNPSWTTIFLHNSLSFFVCSMYVICPLVSARPSCL